MTIDHTFFVCWVDELRRRFTLLPAGTTRSVFRLLFPEEDVQRKYGMQEKLLCTHLAQCTSVPIEELRRWDVEGFSGCLGQEFQKALLTRSSTSIESPLSISDVDNLLDELASTSEYSAFSLRSNNPTPRTPQTILRQLYRSLSPSDASFVTQIILKDLRPLLYPLPSDHYTSALTSYNSNSVQPLSVEDAMRIWDVSGQLLKAYRLKPVIDSIPKSQKGRSCLHALSYFKQAKRVWVETKYDGERAQIHLEILPTGESKITIFSKSKRNSTQDREAIHGTIQRAVGMSGTQPTERFKCNIVLDAEMVACHGNAIDEFWRIRDLLANEKSRASNDDRDRHLGLVFFDILVLDSLPLTQLPYSQRRELLESVIETSVGHIFLAERTPIDLTTANPERQLQATFAQSIASFEEGVVLKADESTYHDYRLPWVKLKKDYIPGYGDAVDLVILGASWDKKRGRELRVPPTTYTTFYIGALANAKQIDANSTLKPHFYVYFTVSYGLTREQLEDLNFSIKSLGTLPYRQLLDSMGYTFTLSPSLPVPPAVVFAQPLLAELVGAGFTKSVNCKYYELRFPRTWRDEIAMRCVGKDRPLKDVDDCSSPSVRSRLKRKALASLDGDSKGFNSTSTMSTDLEHTAFSPRFSVTHIADPIPDTPLQPQSAKELQEPSGYDHVLQDALVWFSKGVDKSTWKEIIPSNRRLHALESLLLGCGWNGTPSRTRNGIKRGIAMVHNHRCKDVVETLRKCKHDADVNKSQVIRRPVLVVDATSFRFGDDIESHVINTVQHLSLLQILFYPTQPRCSLCSEWEPQ
ncbi:hypothetical protein F5887DRAFT_1065164 [Amanita rubescens]|nr:hypothetical protein F5887DRAFT_1065164 [Amanita rubescens]